MGNLVVKDNALITASHRLSEVEQRLILLAILKAREFCDSVEALKDKELIIHANDYIQQFGVDRDTAYKSLKKAVMGLYRAEWGYRFTNTKGNKEVAYERFTQSAKYVENEATVKFMFANAIIPLLVELERNFTTYDIKQVAELSSQYAMRLYEFFVQHLDKKTGKGWLDISLNDLRFRFGILPTEYKAMSDFKKYVLDRAIKQINQHTDLTATYTQQKQGRTIVGFNFEFSRPVKTENKNTPKTPLKTASNAPKTASDEPTALDDQEQQIIANTSAYAESIGASPSHRKNLIKKALNEHRTEKQRQEQAHLEAKQAEKARKQAQEAQKQQAEQLYQKILADDNLVNRYAMSVLAKRTLSGLQAQYFEQGNFKQAVSMEKHHFNNADFVKQLIKMGF